jgi:arginase
MRLHLIAMRQVEGAFPTPGRAAGLAAAADAFLAAGITDRLAAVGAPVASVDHPTIPASEIDADTIVNLGRLNARIAAGVGAAMRAGDAPVLLGGTCSHLPGMLGGIQQVVGTDARIGLLWLDAHGDFNTPRTSLSQMLGGMPVAVCAGLCYPAWREGAGLRAPIPTDRIVMVDVRNLDEAEEALIRATDVTVARFGPAFDPAPVLAAVDALAARVDHLYVHVDADILDASLQPNHPTVEPGGPGVAPVLAVLARAFASGKARAFGLVSVNPTGDDGAISLASGGEVLIGGVAAWVAAGDRAVY